MDVFSKQTQDSIVNIVTKIWAAWHRVLFPERARDFSFFHNIQSPTQSGMISLTGCKQTRAWSWPLTSTSIKCLGQVLLEPYLCPCYMPSWCKLHLQAEPFKFHSHWRWWNLTYFTGRCKFWFQVGLAPSAAVVLALTPWNETSTNGRTGTIENGGLCCPPAMVSVSFRTGTWNAWITFTMTFTSWPARFCRVTFFLSFLVGRKGLLGCSHFMKVSPRVLCKDCQFVECSERIIAWLDFFPEGLFKLFTIMGVEKSNKW